MEIFDSPFKSTLVMLDQKLWLPLFALNHPRGVLGRLRSSSSTPSLIHVLVHCCAVMLKQEGVVPKQLPQSWSHGSTQNPLLVLSLEFTPNLPFTNVWHDAVTEISFSWRTPTRLSDFQMICHSRGRAYSPASAAACFTPLHPTLGITLGDVWLGWTMETNRSTHWRLCQVWRSVGMDSAESWRSLPTICWPHTVRSPGPQIRDWSISTVI